MAEHPGGAALELSAGNSPSFVSVVGDMFGDYSDAGSSSSSSSSDEPETESTAGAGTSPAPSPDHPPAGAEDAATAEPSGASPDEAAVETPADSASPDASDTPSDLDPFEGSSPLSYTVNGETRTFDGVTVLKDGGAIVDPEALAKLQRVVGERDHLYEQHTERHRQFQAIEQATQWKQRGADGTEQVLTGLPAIEAIRVFNAQSQATIRELASVLKPENIDKYVEIGQNEGGYFLQWNKAALDGLRERLQFVTDREGFNERKRFAELTPKASAPADAPETPIETIAAETVDTLAKQLNVTLSPDARSFLSAQLPRYVRATTPAERPKYGARVVDESFAALIQREAKAAETTSKVANTATEIAKANAARLTAAKVGTKPTAPKPSVRRPAATEEPESDPFADAWDRQEKASAGAMRFRQTAGA